jgi:hypothetical protein
MKKPSVRSRQTHHREATSHRGAAGGFGAALLANLKYDEIGNVLTSGDNCSLPQLFVGRVHIKLRL